MLIVLYIKCKNPPPLSFWIYIPRPLLEIWRLTNSPLFVFGWLKLKQIYTFKKSHTGFYGSFIIYFYNVARFIEPYLGPVHICELDLCKIHETDCTLIETIKH